MRKINWYLLNPLLWVSCRYISRELALGYITPLPVLSRDGISQSTIMCDVSNAWSWHVFVAFRLVDSIWSWSVVDIRERERKRLRAFPPFFFLFFLFPFVRSLPRILLLILYQITRGCIVSYKLKCRIYNKQSCYF